MNSFELNKLYVGDRVIFNGRDTTVAGIYVGPGDAHGIVTQQYHTCDRHWFNMQNSTAAGTVRWSVKHGDPDLQKFERSWPFTNAYTDKPVEIK